MRLMGNVCAAPTEFRDGDCGHAGDKHISSVGKIQAPDSTTRNS
jgi:hypothetical protein